MKYFLTILISIISFFIFTILEYGRLPILFNEIIQPIIFALVVATLFLGDRYRQNIFRFSLLLLIAMVCFYFLNQFSISNWVGSLGIGILAILIFSYIPKLIKNGHI